MANGDSAAATTRPLMDDHDSTLKDGRPESEFYKTPAPTARSLSHSPSPLLQIDETTGESNAPILSLLGVQRTSNASSNSAGDLDLVLEGEPQTFFDTATSTVAGAGKPPLVPAPLQPTTHTNPNDMPSGSQIEMGVRSPPLKGNDEEKDIEHGLGKKRLSFDDKTREMRFSTDDTESGLAQGLKRVDSTQTPQTRSHHDEGAKAKEPKSPQSRLVTCLILCFLFMIAEIVGGIIANSMAVLSDAAHLLSDLAGIGISLGALWLSKRPATDKLTWGYHRAEVLGAMLSISLVWVMTGVLVYEAILRVIYPEDVDGKIMFITASAGLVVNLLMLGVLGHGHGHSHGGGECGGGGGGHSHAHGHSHGGDHSHHNHGHSHGTKKKKHASVQGGSSEDTYMSLGDNDSHASLLDGNAETVNFHQADNTNINVSSALIHVIGDLVQSIGVMIAAAVIWAKPEYRLADPICTFVFSVLVMLTTYSIMKESVFVLLESVPSSADIEVIRNDLSKIESVVEVHDLHIWSITRGKVALAVHLTATDTHQALLDAQQVCCKDHKIHHSTIQVEHADLEQVDHCYGDIHQH